MTAVLPPPTTTSPQGRRRKALTPWALAASVLTGQAMASLDTAIVNVGGPTSNTTCTIAATLQLAVYSYILLYAISLIPGARLGGRHGYGRTFSLGVALFTASSLACGLAASPAMLIASRSIQGLGAALLVPQVLSLLQTAFDGEHRRRALNLYGLVLALGVAAGQVLGGVLVTANLFGTSWRPIFLVNVPFGLAVLTACDGRLPAGAETGYRRRLDLTGAVLLALSVLALVAPLTFGPDTRWPPWCWPVLAAGVALLAVFAVHQSRLAAAGRDPLVDPALVAPRPVRTGLAGVFVLMGCYGGLLFTTALFLQQALHDSALRSGLTFATYAAGFAIAALAWSRLPAAWHPRIRAVCFAAIAAATATMAWATSDNSWPWQASILLAVAGAGHGAGFGALVHRTAGFVAAQHAASFSGVLSTVNQLAIVTGIAAAGALYTATGSSGRSLPQIAWVLAAIAGSNCSLAR